MTSPADSTPTFSVIVPTTGRPTLTRSLASVTPQLVHGDELLVLRSDARDWGSAARTSAMERARGSHLVFLDDDDALVPDALATIRGFAAANPGRIGIFRMRFELHPVYGYGEVLWADKELRWGNVGGSMLVIPNVPGKVPRWHSGERGMDWRFIQDAVALHGDPIFCEQVIARIRPVDRWLVPWAFARPRLKALRNRLRGST